MAGDVISGYQELKRVLSEMRMKKYQKIEIEYTTLYKIFRELQSLKYQKNILLDEIKKLKNSKESQQSKKLDDYTNSLLSITEILRDLKAKTPWIEYKNKTVHTNEFYRIEKENLDKIIEEMVGNEIEVKNILDVMANMGILRKQDNKIISSATVNGATKRIYMVRKDSIDLLE